MVNGMAFDRASAADYNAWEQLGNAGWNWASLLYYFKKSTTLTPPKADNVRDFGTTYDASAYGNGPVQASFPNFEYPDMKDIWASWKAAGVPLPKEHALGNAVGAYWIPTSLRADTQTRSHAKNAYYDPVKSRSNLVLITGKTVNEILFSQGLLTGYTANGVQFKSRSDGSVKKVYARREVILAAGAVFTPQLLQLSGIGPRSVLSAAGICKYPCSTANQHTLTLSCSGEEGYACRRGEHAGSSQCQHVFRPQEHGLPQSIQRPRPCI